MGNWRCSDIGTAVYQGYASAIEQAELERLCGPVKQAGTLPFTGLDVGLLFVVGIILVAIGVTATLLSRRG